MVRLLKGFFGATEDYAIMDFELCLTGQVINQQTFVGELEVGAMRLNPPTVGAPR